MSIFFETDELAVYHPSEQYNVQKFGPDLTVARLGYDFTVSLS